MSSFSSEKSSRPSSETGHELKAFFEKLGEALLVLDNEGCILEANRAAIRLYEIPPDQLLGSSFMDWIPPESRPSFQQAWRQFLETELLQSEMEIYRANGSSCRIEITAKAHFIPDRHILLLRKVTDSLQQENELQRQNQELERQLQQATAHIEELQRELESFTYSVSHDLRTPLRHIEGFLQILKRKMSASLTLENQKLFDAIFTAAQEMSTLIQGLLSLSRINRAEFHKIRLSFNELTATAIRQVQSQTERRKIEWIVQDLPEVEGDPTLLLQVLGHLLSNAVKFTQPKPVAQIEIGSQDREGEVVIFVRDNGVGFDMKYASRLFGAFQRLHPIEAFGGIGISLAIARRIIQRHGGRIWAEGSVDRGATFYFSIPRPSKSV